MKNKALLFLTVFSILQSCKKEGFNYVKGTVYEIGSGIPVPGASVYLHKNSTSGKENIIDSASTNENGEYEIKFSKNIGTDYEVSCKCANYFDKKNSLDSRLEHGRNALNFSLTPHAYLKLRYIKTSNLNHTIVGMVNGRNIPFMNPGALTSMYDTLVTSTILLFGNQNNSMEWYTLDPSMKGDGAIGPKTFETFFVKKGETITYTFLFN